MRFKIGAKVTLRKDPFHKEGVIMLGTLSEEDAWYVGWGSHNSWHYESDLRLVGEKE